MDKTQLIKHLDTVETFKDYLKNHASIENYKKGQIIKSSNEIKVISIIGKGSIRQIDKINGRETTRYKYLKDDFLFVNNLFGTIFNKSKFIASEDSILLSIDIQQFKKDLKTDKKLSDWLESTSFTFEYINFISEVLKDRFLSNQEISNLFLELKNNSIIVNLQKTLIDEKNIERINSHLLFSLSNNTNYKYAEKISVNKDDKLPTIKRVILINSAKLKHLKIYLNDLEKKPKKNVLLNDNKPILDKKTYEIKKDKINRFSNKFLRKNAKNIQKNFLQKNQDFLKFSEYSSNQDFRENIKQY